MRRSTAGSALVEMLLVAPLLLLLLVGLIEVGRFGDFAIKVASAARAGVQYGAQNHGTAADITGMQTAATNDAAASGVSAVASYYCQCEDGTASTCGSVNPCSTTHQNLYVQVIATGTMSSILNYAALPASLKTVTIVQTAVMRVAQ